MTKTIDKEILRHFHGTENWYHHGIARNILYTDGARRKICCRDSRGLLVAG